MKSNHTGSDFVSEDLLSVSSFSVRSEPHKEHCVTNNRISEKLNEKLLDVVQALKIFDKQRNGKILPVNLHNVLNIFCHPVTLKEFEDLLRKEKLDENGLVCYKTFLSKFTSKIKELHDACRNKENRNEVLNENTEEIEMKVKQKISKNIKNFIRSMWLYDFNQDGLIQKHEFRNVLENYCLPLSDDQFDSLWSLYDPNGRGVLDYKEFLLKLGTRSEAYKRIMQRSTQSKKHGAPHTNSRQEQLEKRYAKLGRDDPEIQGQVFSKVIDTFKQRIEKNFPVLLRIFQIKDSSKSGCIPLTVFHQVLNYFVMPMSLQLFKQVLTRFNISPTANKIQWYEFLKSVCIKDPESIKDISNFPSSHSWYICKSIMEKIRKSGTNSQNFFKNCFIMPNQDQNKTITRAELRRTINQYLIFPLQEEEFRALMFLLDPGHTNVVDCQKFLALLNVSDSEGCSRLERELSVEEFNSGCAFHGMSGGTLIKEFRKSFNSNFKNVEKAINAFDCEETGFMHVEDFRKILDTFCFPLTQKQFQEISKDFSSTSNKIFYTDFIKHYKKTPYENEEKWALCVTKLTAPQTTNKCLGKEEILRSVRTAVKAHKEIFLEEFKNHDYCNAGIARKEVFSKLIDKHVFRLTQEQLDSLWDTLPVNEIGLLKYETFLNELANDPTINSYHGKTAAAASHDIHRQSPSPSTMRSFQSASGSISIKNRPHTASSVATSKTGRSLKCSPRPKSAVSKQNSWDGRSELGEESSTSSRGHFTLQGCGVLTHQQYKQFKALNFGNSRPCSRTSNSSCKTANRNNIAFYEKSYAKENEPAKSRYLDNDKKLFVQQVKSRWRDILRRCRAQDSGNMNTISWNEFISILHNTGVNVDDAILDLLQAEYTIKNGLPINYWTFFKKIHLSLGLKKSTHNKEVVIGMESVGLYKLLLTIRDKVLKNYRDLRHAFRRADQQHSGSIKASEFRKILHLHKINLSESDFFYICDYFDPKLTELIQYDSFLETFIKS